MKLYSYILLGESMRIENSIFDENGKTFQEIIEQFLLVYYNEGLVNDDQKMLQ